MIQEKGFLVYGGEKKPKNSQTAKSAKPAKTRLCFANVYALSFATFCG
jgi:hypothetical protein